MWVGVTVEEDEEVEGESKFVAGAQQGKMDEYSEGGANAVAPGSPKLEIKRLLYTIIHDAMHPSFLPPTPPPPGAAGA